jgi:uncharacterized repeat protein (TIGR03803 family)
MKTQAISASLSICWTTATAILLFCAATAAPSPAQTFTTLVTFDSSTGEAPNRPLVQGTDGNLYGETSLGPGNYDTGTVFTMTSTGTLTTLHTFLPHGLNGVNPSGLVLADNGAFYGTSYFGGPDAAGTIFRITSTGQLALLHTFDHTDGAIPSGPLIQGADGNFYGTTNNGGINSSGSVFKITPAGTLTTLYNFCSLTNCADGEYPFGPLVQGTDGNFYGTTQDRGAHLNGTIFKITPSGTLTTLHSFCSETNCADGYLSFGLIQASDGNFYGTTEAGNDLKNSGTVFKITPGGTFTTLYTFSCAATCPDGNGPNGTLIQATDGNFYGVTVNGGSSSSCETCFGTIFQITPAGALTTLHTFDVSDGEFPETGLLQATDGSFYGSTFEGGANNGSGTIFSLSTGLGPFVALVQKSGKVGQTGGILGQGFTGTTAVSINGTSATFTVVSDTFLSATIPAGATSGFVTVTTPTGVLTSNVPFTVTP